VLEDAGVVIHGHCVEQDCKSYRWRSLCSRVKIEKKFLSSGTGDLYWIVGFLFMMFNLIWKGRHVDCTINESKSINLGLTRAGLTGTEQGCGGLIGRRFVEWRKAGQGHARHGSRTRWKWRFCDIGHIPLEGRRVCPVREQVARFHQMDLRSEVCRVYLVPI
jgi:hypothetical protein